MNDPTPRTPPQTPGQRVRVTGPPRRRGESRAPGAAEIDRQSAIGAILFDSLLSDQRRLVARTLTAVVLVLGALPLLFHLVPGITDLRVVGLPVPYLVLGVAVHPVLVVLAVLFVRRAEAHERAFRDLVDDGPGPTG